MPKLPVVSHKELIKFLEKYGYSVERQKGSHVRLKKLFPSGHHSITVPTHKEIARGTLSDILEKVSIYTQTSKSKLIEELSQL
jgi:predicted RNA binding protein YcfA (HicA-like mRNA interferase family)